MGTYSICLCGERRKCQYFLVDSYGVRIIRVIMVIAFSISRKCLTRRLDCD